MTRVIYKVCSRAQWQDAMASGHYRGSRDDLRDGFIHFSTADQLSGTLAKHFSGQKDLVLISVAAAELGDKLKWEASRGGRLFPHLYADLPVTAAMNVVALKHSENGHIIPALEEE